jgi:hypothetical protein
MSAFDPLAPIETAVRYGEQRAIREAEERENPALICERTAHIAIMGDGICLTCGEVIW